MRVLKQLIGLFLVSATALAQQAAAPASPVVVGPHFYEGQYTDTRVKDQDRSRKTFSIERAHEFHFPGSSFSVDPESQRPVFARDKASEVTLRYPDGTLTQADCRNVAMDLVQALVGYRVDAHCRKGWKNFEKRECNPDGRDGEGRTFKDRTSRLDIAVMASLLQKITITRGEPQVRCKQTTVADADGETRKAWCGDLWIAFKPLSEPVGFDPDSCEDFKDSMDEGTCQTALLLRGCGLRYVQKALMKDEGDPTHWGLANQLEYYLANQLCLLQVGDPVKCGLRKAVPIAGTTAVPRGYRTNPARSLH